MLPITLLAAASPLVALPGVLVVYFHAVPAGAGVALGSGSVTAARALGAAGVAPFDQVLIRSTTGLVVGREFIQPHGADRFVAQLVDGLTVSLDRNS